MPELPEVETIARELKSKIKGRTITDCIILRPDVIAHPKPVQFCREIVGEKILNVSRKAKYLIVELGSEKRLVFHLRLSGTIAIIPSGARHHRFSRLVLVLNDGQLLFNEPRVLGRVSLLRDGEVLPNLKGYYNLGCEPISDDFTPDYLKGKIRNRKARIKTLLLDQNVCAGMGNIYSDEALFRAGIRPMRRANRITNQELEKLTKALRDVITEGILNFGTSVSDYTRTNGKNGNFQNFLRVYGREGEPCRKCGTKIALKKIGNRGTRYCPKCQH